jgi:hypothetical protein
MIFSVYFICRNAATFFSYAVLRAKFSTISSASARTSEGTLSMKTYFIDLKA